MINNPHLAYLKSIALADVEGLEKADSRYGDSWIKRGGPGAYFVTVRKIDRLEEEVKSTNFDIFEAVRKYPGKDGTLDTIRDLRRYLMLIEAEILLRKGTHPDWSYSNKEVISNVEKRLGIMSPSALKKNVQTQKTEQDRPFGYISEKE
jgi:hypothetical protein